MTHSSKHLPRRRFIQLSLAGATATAINPARAREVDPPPAKAKACIVLFLHGGISHIDTFDPKQGPWAGPFASIPTNVTGVRLGEHLPKLSRRMNQVALLRSVTSREGSHARARYLMRTGYAPQGGVRHPSLGSLVAAARGKRALPGYVSIGVPGQGPGMLGAAYAPFHVVNPTQPVRNIRPTQGVSPPRVRRRLDAWRELQSEFGHDRGSRQIAGHNAVFESAVSMMNARELAAFDLNREPQALRARYGNNPFGQGCLMARRLVEAGVGYIEVGMRGWDTHRNNFDKLSQLCPILDAGMSTLLADLKATGLLEETLVMMVGDFGRTPRITPNGGRGHHPRVSSVVLAGAQIEGGQVIGASDKHGDEVIDRPITVPDLFHTVALRLGLDPNETRLTSAGRPISNVDGGSPIRELG